MIISTFLGVFLVSMVRFPFFVSGSLHDAIKDGNLDLVSKLLHDKNVDVNAYDTDGMTALGLAIKTSAGSLDLTKTTKIINILLSDPKIDVNKGHINGDSPLHLAVEAMQIPILKLLLAVSDVQVNQTTPSSAYCTPLLAAIHKMAKDQHVEAKNTCILLLSNSKIDINVSCGHFYPLLEAIRFTNDFIVSRMIQMSIPNPNVVDHEGNSALFLALDSKKILPNTFKKLCTICNNDYQDSAGNTILHRTSAEIADPTVRKYLQSIAETGKASWNIANHEGDLPSHIFLEKMIILTEVEWGFGNAKVMEALEKQDAKVFDYPGKNGDTLIHLLLKFILSRKRYLDDISRLPASIKHFLSVTRFNANAQNAVGETVFHLLVDCPSAEFTESFLQWISPNKIDISIKSNTGMTAIQAAMEKGNLHMIQHLFRSSFDETNAIEAFKQLGPRLSSQFVSDLLNVSLQKRWHDFTAILIDPDQNGLSKELLIYSEEFLSVTMLQKNIKGFQLLWPFYQNSKLTDAILQEALKCGVQEIYETFESHGGYDMSGPQSYTKAHWAARHGWIDYLKGLLDNSSFDINMQNEHGESLLHAALKGEDVDKRAQLIMQNRLPVEDLKKSKLENLLKKVRQVFVNLFSQPSDGEARKNGLFQVERLRIAAYQVDDTSVFDEMQALLALHLGEDDAEIFDQFETLRVEAFRKKVVKKITMFSETIDLTIDREHILNSAISELQRAEFEGANLSTMGTNITFMGQKGADGGALTIEFFASIGAVIFGEECFEKIGAHGEYVNIKQVKDDQEISAELIEKYRFAGKIIGMALLNQGLMSVLVSRALLRQLLEQTDDWKDIREIDPDQYKTYHDTIYDTSKELFESFEATYDKLLPNGDNIPVQYADRAKYVAMSVSRTLTDGRHRQAKAMRAGLNEVISSKDLLVLRPSDLQKLIGGSSEIDIDDWKTNTVYKDVYTKDHPTIVHFWNTLTAHPDLRRKIFKYATGYQMVPLGGMARLKNGKKFTISLPLEPTPGNLPKAVTCSMHLYYPPYRTLEETEEALFAVSNIDTFDNA